MLSFFAIFPALAGNIEVVSSGPTPQASVKFVAHSDVVEVGIVRATDVSRVGNARLIEKFYEDLCSTPCELTMDVGWHEFHFARGKREWSKKVEVRPGTQTVEVKLNGAAGYTAGMVLTSTLLGSPIGLPLMIAYAPRLHRLE